MKKLMTLLSVFVLIVVTAPPVQANQPLYGEMNLEFNLAWPGPSETIPDWFGTITINGIEYGMLFYNFWTGKPFANPFKGNVDHPTIFFGERWEISDLATGELLLWGYDDGVTTVVNNKFRMNGNVVGAFGIFEGWEGRSVHMSGVIEWYPFGAPHFAVGPFRIN